jgi:signal transduction histidine kinase
MMRSGDGRVSVIHMSRLAGVGDLALAALFVLAGELDVWVRGTVQGSRPLNAAILAFVGLPLVVRRRRPELTVVVVAAAVLTQALAVGRAPSGFLYWPILIAAYSLGAHGPARRRQLATLALLVGAYAYLTVEWASTGGVNVTAVPWMFAPVLAWVAGMWMRRRRRRSAADAARVQRERDDEQRRLAALEHERVRMARELHDILAHSVSLMGVQAGAAEQVLANDPERARPVLQSIQQTARDSVGELHRLLSMLRAHDVGPELSPQPSLHDLEALFGRMRDAGLNVEWHTRGSAAISPGIELTVYRVVQEALTNALKHARPTRVAVELTYAGNRLDVDVWNDGVDDTSRGSGTGHGLLGMRERVSLYGGSLEAAREAAGGFRVLASIPLA